MCDIVQGFVDEGREKEREELIKKMLDANLVTPEQSDCKLSLTSVRHFFGKLQPQKFVSLFLLLLIL